MLKTLVKHLANETAMTQTKARRVLGIVLNAAERQGAPFADQLFRKLPGARTLSAKTGDEVGAANGVIARLIEQTPGGRRHVASEMIRQLHGEGLGHEDIGKILPTVASFVEETYGFTGFGHLGDLLGADLDIDMANPQSAVA